MIQDATAMLERVATTLSGIVPETRVLLGDPVEALTAVSREEDSELLIVGSRGRGPLSAAVLGSVSARLASAAERPIVVVPSADAADRFLARAAGGQLVCGLDDSAGSIRALQLAAGLAERMQLELLPVHIDPDATWQDVPLGTPAPRLKVYSGDPVEGLRERVMDADASALVVGSGGRGAWRAAALGSVSGALAATAPVPVVVLPPTAQVTRLAETVDATVADALRRARYWTARRTQEAASTDHPIRRPPSTMSTSGASARAPSSCPTP